MNTTQVTLPDGRLLKIEGANAAQAAAIIKNDFTKNVPAGAGAETPLEVPALNFAPAAVPTAEDETPLVMPAVV